MKGGEEGGITGGGGTVVTCKLGSTGNAIRRGRAPRFSNS